MRALSAGAAADVVAATAALAPEAIAVVLLHSYAHPEHERVLGHLLAERLPGVHVSLSHEVVGTFREFERAATTEVDAALSPLLRDYLRRELERARRRRPARRRGHAVRRRAARPRHAGRGTPRSPSSPVRPAAWAVRC